MNEQELLLLLPQRDNATNGKLSSLTPTLVDKANEHPLPNVANGQELHLGLNSILAKPPQQPAHISKHTFEQRNSHSSCQPTTQQAGPNAQNYQEKTHIKRCRHAIRSFCLECQGRLSTAVEACEDHNCKLYPFRLTTSENLDLKKLSQAKPLRAVRQHCLICCGGERDELRRCTAGKTCSLWPFRFGVSPVIYRKVKEKWRGPKHYSLPGL